MIKGLKVKCDCSLGQNIYGRNSTNPPEFFQSMENRRKTLSHFSVKVNTTPHQSLVQLPQERKNHRPVYLMGIPNETLASHVSSFSKGATLYDQAGPIPGLQVGPTLEKHCKSHPGDQKGKLQEGFPRGWVG